METMTKAQPLDCQTVDELVRRHMLDQLTADVRKHENEFLLAIDWGEPELGAEAIAEWAYGLLEAQKRAIMEAVERALEPESQ